MSKVKKVLSNDYMSAVMVLVVLIIAMAILSPVFLTGTNLINVLNQVIVYAILGAGMSCVIYTGGIDLSVGAILAVAGILCGKMMHANVPMVLAIIGGILVAVVIGAANGFLVSYCKLQPMIATLGVFQIARGVALTITGGRTVTGFSDAFKWIGNGKLFGTEIPVAVLFMLIIYIIVYYVMKYRRLGRILYSIGGNQEATRLSGINVRKYKMYSYMINGLMAGIAGIIYTAKLNSAQGIAGEGYELDAIAAAVIGGTSLLGGRGSIWGTLIGAIVMGVIRNGMNLLNISSYIQQIVLGAIIILAVLFDSYKAKLMAKSK
ncbi:MAG: ABC transporter permease [Ruminococcus sp.]